MTRPPFARPSLLFGSLAVAATLLMAACGTGPIPGQSSSQTSTSTSSQTSASSGCTAASAKTAVTVDATNSFKFVPASVCLKVGGTITWKNVGNLPHTTTDIAGLAANPANAALPKGAVGWNRSLAPGASYSLKFTVPGAYKYFCIPHELLGMVGQITVVS